MTERRKATRFSVQVADQICRRIAAGERLATICADEGMPARSTIARWARCQPGFAAAYADARERRFRAGHVAARPPAVRRRGAVRPSRAVLAEICTRLAQGEFLERICEDAHMPRRQAVNRWVRENPEFAARYTEARQIQVERMFDQILAIADDEENPVRARLRIDARKWLVTKLAPLLFGTGDDKGRAPINILVTLIDQGRERVRDDDQASR